MPERRRFFRISDRVGVACRVLTDEEAQSRQDRNPYPVDTLSLLSRYENTIDALLPQIKSKETAELLGALNNKINCIVAQLELDSRLVRDIAHRVQKVNISACGMAFVFDQSVAVGRMLSLDLVLRPEGNHIATYGQVLDCEATDDGYFIRLNFLALSPHDQEVLIQHIVKRQGTIIREHREMIDLEEQSELQASMLTKQNPI